jgi:UDP-N-acetylmuramyl pentapeptide synthase
VSFKISNQNRLIPVKILGSFGRGQAYAAAAAAAVGSLLGLNFVQIAEALATNYKPAVGRSRILKGIKDSTLIDDTYNSSPAALKEALETLKSLPAKRRIAVLGDMLELGTHTMEAHETAGRQAAKACDILVAVGLRAKMSVEASIKAGLPKRSVFYFSNLREAGTFLQEKIGRGDVILFKASQGVRLEKIVKEVMAEPQLAPNLLPRQNFEWLAKPGLYD